MGRGAGRGRPRRPGGAPRAHGAGVPRADGQRAATSAVPASGAVVHALAGAPRRPRPARRVAARQRVVARGQRAPAARRMRDGRALRRARRPAVVGGGAALAGVRRATGAPGTRPRCSRCGPGTSCAPSVARRGGGRAGALLHERRARAGAVRARARRGAAPRARPVRSARPRARRPAPRHGRRLPLTPPGAAEPLSASARRRALHRRRAAARPDARLRGDRAAAATPARVVGRRTGRAAPL